ncbi:MAG: hypothetical protein AAGD25_18325 [Cyanobacteria bacterium P01_F01_bin.150]
MAKVVAVTKVFKRLAEVEARLNLMRSNDAGFFPEWRSPQLLNTEQENPQQIATGFNSLAKNKANGHQTSKLERIGSVVIDTPGA